MARIARLLCVLGVLSLSTSAFAAMMVPITDAEPSNDDWTTVATALTTGRTGVEPVFGFGTGLGMTAVDKDFFQIDLLKYDYLQVNTSILNPSFATTVTLYDSTGTVIPGGVGAAGYIDNAPAAATYYVGVTGTGTASYMMTFSIDNFEPPIPEPATMSLLAIGGVVLIKRRRKR
ncbi:MAG: PEP-CTERM sorting domain-containing protein [Phycisphaerae bacterium]|jgi:hypothetical protein|nr:PEP-CTERM sorting domain-containing protein [Phycisphaerae bacterium]